MITKSIKNNSGQTIIITLLYLLIISIFLTIFLTSLFSSTDKSSNSTSYQQVYKLTESKLNQIILSEEDLFSPDIAGVTDTYNQKYKIFGNTEEVYPAYKINNTDTNYKPSGKNEYVGNIKFSKIGTHNRSDVICSKQYTDKLLNSSIKKDKSQTILVDETTSIDIGFNKDNTFMVNYVFSVNNPIDNIGQKSFPFIISTENTGNGIIKINTDGTFTNSQNPTVYPTNGFLTSTTATELNINKYKFKLDIVNIKQQINKTLRVNESFKNSEYIIVSPISQDTDFNAKVNSTNSIFSNQFLYYGCQGIEEGNSSNSFGSSVKLEVYTSESNNLPSLFNYVLGIY